MSMDRSNQLHQSSEKYQRRRIRAYIKDIPADKRQEVLEKILARTILGGDTPCRNALETALKELRTKEKIERRIKTMGNNSFSFGHPFPVHPMEVETIKRMNAQNFHPEMYLRVPSDCVVITPPPDFVEEDEDYSDEEE
jgi:hypothetical protein